MEPQHTPGISHFIGQVDAVGMTLLVILLGMSVVTWYLILVRIVQSTRMRSKTRQFMQTFWSAPSVQAVSTLLSKEKVEGPFARLAEHAISSMRHHQRHASATLAESGTQHEFLTRSIRRVIDEETARSEHGLTMLASIGSTAPFVGLFGTVWGVYHALVSIGMSGQGTLDKVAGPVGEALIMTALGLAVAVPAVLAYNFSVRRNRLFLARLDSFAHDIFALLTTGAAVGEEADAAAPASTPEATRVAPAGA